MIIKNVLYLEEEVQVILTCENLMEQKYIIQQVIRKLNYWKLEKDI